jgi:hypothetical protein
MDYRVYVLYLLRRLDRMLSGMSFASTGGPLFLSIYRVQTIDHIEDCTRIESGLLFASSNGHHTVNRLRRGPLWDLLRS